VNCKLITATVNLTLVQCKFHTGKKTVIARIKSIIRNQDTDFRFFQKYLVPNSNFQAEGKCPFCLPCPADTHAIIDYFISGSINKTSSSNETKKRF